LLKLALFSDFKSSLLDFWALDELIENEDKFSFPLTGVDEAWKIEEGGQLTDLTIKPLINFLEIIIFFNQ